MHLTRSRFVRMVRIAAAALAVVVVAGYGAYRSLPYIRGPVIHIFQPLNGSSVSSTTVTVIGRVERVNSLSLNDNPLPVDEAGDFKQTIVVFPGVNILSFDATDQFSRETRVDLQIFGTQNLPEGRSRTGTSTNASNAR